jgi:guanylate kinase
LGLLDFNDERLVKEVVFFADRSDISEELTRVQSHFQQYDDCLKSAEPVGRTLDFLAQEINREINTLGSKANDSLISREIVTLKAELEKFREQVQNVVMRGPFHALLIVISAPSGQQNDACHRLVAASAAMTRAILVRLPRPGERTVDYYFMDPRVSQAREGRELFGTRHGAAKLWHLEAKCSKNCRRTRCFAERTAGSHSNSVQTEELPEQALVTVFITPDSLRVLEERLRKRGQDSDVSIQKRMSVARQEIAQWKSFDYLIISTTIEEDLRRMQAILAAQRMRTNHAKPPLAE